jgi:hypothetical protein
MEIILIKITINRVQTIILFHQVMRIAKIKIISIRIIIIISTIQILNAFIVGVKRH